MTNLGRPVTAATETTQTQFLLKNKVVNLHVYKSTLQLFDLYQITTLEAEKWKNVAKFLENL